MSGIVNPASRYFVVKRPDDAGDTVGRFDVAGDVPIEVGDVDDEPGVDIVVVELNSRSDLGNHPLDVEEDWFAV